MNAFSLWLTTLCFFGTFIKQEEKIFVDPSDRDDLPDVVDDFDLDFNAGSSEVRKRSPASSLWNETVTVYVIL